MPSPSTSLATLRPDLAESYVEFDLEQNREGFIARRVLPVLEVDKQAGTFGRIPADQLLVSAKTERAPGAPYSRGKMTFKPDSYVCMEHGYEEPIDENEAAMYRSFFNVEQMAANRAYSVVGIAAEQRAADLLFDTTTWTGAALATTVSNKWDVYGSATPITDVENAVHKVYDGSGHWPNAMILSRKAFRHLRNIEQILERLKYAGIDDPKVSGRAAARMLAELFDLDELIVAGGTKNSANEGATFAPASIWDKSMAMVARIPRTQDVREVGVGRTFHWDQDGSEYAGAVETYRDERVRGDVVRVRNQTHEKLFHVVTAHLLEGVL